MADRAVLLVEQGAAVKRKGVAGERVLQLRYVLDLVNGDVAALHRVGVLWRQEAGRLLRLLRLVVMHLLEDVYGIGTGGAEGVSRRACGSDCRQSDSGGQQQKGVAAADLHGLPSPLPS